MTRRYSVRNLIVDYLETVEGERTRARIIQYMEQMHKVTPSATTTTLSRLVSAGLIKHVGVGRYERKRATEPH